MVPEAAENNGPMIFAPMGVLPAVHRHHVRDFDTSRKPHHWESESSGGRMTVLIYVDTSKQVGDRDHLKVFANEDAAETWLQENDPEGVVFEYEVME
jgi:hypothetical protein